MKTANKTRQHTTAALCAALLCVVSPRSIVIGPISLTLAVFGVFFAGAMLASPGMAAAAVLVYMALGAVGLPVFSNNMGGAQVLVGVTAGFLWAYPVMAAILAAACRRWQGLLPRLGAVLLGQLVCYTLGTAWFMFVMKMGLLPSLTASGHRLVHVCDEDGASAQPDRLCLSLYPAGFSQRSGGGAAGPGPSCPAGLNRLFFPPRTAYPSGAVLASKRALTDRKRGGIVGG